MVGITRVQGIPYPELALINCQVLRSGLKQGGGGLIISKNIRKYLDLTGEMLNFAMC